MINRQEVPLLVSLDKIWDRAPHNALTDLILYKNEWFCCFREGNKHVHGTNGIIRIIKSRNNAVSWETSACIEQEGVDLRDPKLSITPDGRLMLLMGGSVFSTDNAYITRQPRVSFSEDGVEWSSLVNVLSPHDWLWRITWHQGVAYGVSYCYSDTQSKLKEWYVHLYKSTDGINYQHITQWDVKGYPNETTLQFLPSNQMVALLRRDKKHDDHAWIGLSNPPYEEWTWRSCGHYFGGPNFIILPDNTIWAAGRLIASTPYGLMERTAVAVMDFEGIHPQLILPSGGDCSYPGMVYHQGLLWVSYYSSHEGKASIYLAKILLP